MVRDVQICMGLVIAHGGAGKYSEKTVGKNNDILDELTNEASNMIDEDKKSIDVAEFVVNRLEDDEHFNAGYGSKLQIDGTPRPEAGLMYKNRNTGGIIGLEGIKNASSVARLVMERSNNNIIGSPFSTEFALMHGFEKEDLVTESNLERWVKIKKELEGLNYEEKMDLLKQKDKDTGTVGCVALDNDGDMCAITSTGGRWYQLEGRIGDSPLPGCGYYCDNELAVSTTGVGESIMESQLASRVSMNYNRNKGIEEAVSESLDHLNDKTAGYAGIIAISEHGESTAQVSNDSIQIASSIKRT